MDYLKTNQELWNELVHINAKSKLYNLDEFKRGELSLKNIEINELREVNGKKLLHLQCHFGMDTMSWARLGANVTGVDFSEKAIELAKNLSKELSIPSRFICTDIFELPKVLKDSYDIVFTSYGVLCWMSDLKKWAKVITEFLKPGGTFYIVEFHPLLNIFDNSVKTQDLNVVNSYFHSSEPTKWESEGAYADKQAVVSSPSFEWMHSIGDILNALISEGLEIEFFHEYPYCCYDHFPFMEEGKDGMWRIRGGKEIIPMMFSVKAIKK